LRKKFKIIILLCFAASLLLVCQDSHAQTNPPDTSTEQVWTDEDWQKAIDGVEYVQQPKKEEKQKEKNDFEIPEATSRWNGDWLTSPTTKVIVIIFTIALLIFTLVKLLGNAGNANVKVLNNNISIQELTEENFIETDLEKLLRLALEANDYRSAVRILYLSTIQQLNAQGLILWKKDKTNKDFLREMRAHGEYKTFRDITLAYEIVWYGDRQIEQPQFSSLKQIVDSFSQKIILEQKAK
jgi:hypothetical protein